MGKFTCPDGCCEPETDEPRQFKNAQTLKMHLLHMQGVNGHPKRTMDEIERAIYSPKVLPEPPKIPGVKIGEKKK